jgi:hypothetical protein
MLNNLHYKSKQFFFVLIKLSIIGGAFYVIIQKLRLNENLSPNEFWTILLENRVFSIKIITLLMILTGFNWFFEIKKWQLLVSKVQDISFKLATQQSLSALTVSIITPNKIGDYGAKALFFPNYLRGKILFLNLIGNFWQMAVTVLFGVIGLVFLINHFNFEPIIFRPWHMVILFVIIALFVLIVRFKNHSFQGVSIAQMIKFTQTLTLKAHINIALLSILRYLVFSFQLYLLASVIPVIQVFDAAVKGSIAIMIFSFFEVPGIVVLSAITCMWLLNVVLPAMIGSVFLYNIKTATAS